MVKIEVFKKARLSDLDDINILVAQIAAKPHLLSFQEFTRVVKQRHCRLVVARSRAAKKSAIIGMATVTLNYIPTGLVAVVEDVVVDASFRGQGIGKKLIRKLIDIASRLGAKHISLYTGTGFSRAAANKMYHDLGFFKKDVNYYRVNLLLPKPASRRAIEKLLAERKNDER